MGIFSRDYKKIESKPEPEIKPVEQKTGTKNSLKSEHLKHGIRPIIACIGTPEQFRQNLNRKSSAELGFHEAAPSEKNNNRNIDYYGHPEELRQQNFKNADRNSYVISAVDSSNKFSKGFKNCTGLIVSGLEKDTGKNISFVSHHDPDYFLSGDEAEKLFNRDLREQLEELKKRCGDGTIDAVIVGGNYFENLSESQTQYLKSIRLLSEEVQGVLGFEPVVMTGPKNRRSGQDDVFYDNEQRRLYIMRPAVGEEFTKSYLPSDVKNQEKRWLSDVHD